MTFKIRKLPSGAYKEVIVEEGTVKLDLGLHSDKECLELAKQLKSAIGDLIPDNEERAKFLSEDE